MLLLHSRQVNRIFRQRLNDLAQQVRTQNDHWEKTWILSATKANEHSISHQKSKKLKWKRDTCTGASPQKFSMGLIEWTLGVINMTTSHWGNNFTNNVSKNYFNFAKSRWRLSAMKTRGADALRYFPSRRHRYDRLNIQQLIFKKKTFLREKKFQCRCWWENSSQCKE